MKLFDLEWDAVGFTKNESLLDLEISEENAEILTEQMKAQGQLPSFVKRIISAHIAPDEKEGGQWKVFGNVRVQVEAPTMDFAALMEPPEKFLLAVLRVIADSELESLGFEGTFEILLLDEVTPNEPEEALA